MKSQVFESLRAAQTSKGLHLNVRAPPMLSGWRWSGVSTINCGTTCSNAGTFAAGAAGEECLHVICMQHTSRKDQTPQKANAMTSNTSHCGHAPWCAIKLLSVETFPSCQTALSPAHHQIRHPWIRPLAI